MHTNRPSVIERALGWLALFLIGLAGWAVERVDAGTRIQRITGHLVLAAITATGRGIDRLSRPPRDVGFLPEDPTRGRPGGVTIAPEAPPRYGVMSGR
jgi:hypothetical protein